MLTFTCAPAERRAPSLPGDGAAQRRRERRAARPAAGASPDGAGGLPSRPRACDAPGAHARPGDRAPARADRRDPDRPRLGSAPNPRGDSRGGGGALPAEGGAGRAPLLWERSAVRLTAVARRL